MRDGVQVPRLSAAKRLAAASLLASLAAACNGSQRFAENPIFNPFRSDPVATGSLPPAEVADDDPTAAPPPASRVSSAPLAPVSSARPSAAPTRVVTAPAPVTGGPAGWNGQGGTIITVAHGDTAQTLSTRYGVPPAALLAANGMKGAAEIKPGGRIVIPVYNSGGAKLAAASPQPNLKLVKGPEPAKPAKPVKEPEKIAKAPPPANVEKAAQIEPKATKTVAAPASEPSEPAKAARTPEKVASLAPEPQETAALQDKPEIIGFRWPARGRVIAGFGAKGGNEGINIALPEGTPVKAAEGGTIAYAGSELKGYGNLVLVRHDNGWVSAYANNGEILVKRGDKVKRGQTISKSGQTGNVSSPQLHFELRKGATPVDPLPHLSGG